MPYALIRSDRRTVSLRLLPDGTAEVRAPRRMPVAAVDRFVAEHEPWLRRQREKRAAHAERYPEPTEAEREACIRAASERLPELVATWSERLGVRPAAVTVTGARTRFGSCSGRDRLSFSWRLMRYPPETVEAVVVHELAHIRYKNHQKEFYDFVLSALPDYRERVKALKG